MLADDIDNAAATWAAATAFVSMMLLQIGKMVTEARKDKRLLLAELAREARETAGETAKQKSLERIADANERALELQGQVAVHVAEVKGALVGSDKLAALRHEELLTALRVRCPLMAAPRPDGLKPGLQTISEQTASLAEATEGRQTKSTETKT